jgi:phosphate transport system permease protein|tara:strand:+ start:239 stop:1615 length:1377 start_codon:yes stop_codon:yes gene_type:complete
MNTVLIFIILLLALTSYLFGRKKAVEIGSSNKLKALPQFYGYYLAIWSAAPALIAFCLWSIFEPTIVKTYILSDYVGNEYSDNAVRLIYEKVRALEAGHFTGNITNALERSAEKYRSVLEIASMAKFTIVLVLLVITLSFGYTQLIKNIPTREPTEKFVEYLLLFASFAAVMTTVGIIFSLLMQTLKFFQVVNLFDFLTGTHWYPAKTFVRDGMPDPELLRDAFGAVPLFAGTFFIALIAMCVAIPIGLLSGIYISEYGSRKFRVYAKPTIEILAGIPTVVYGFFAALTVGPFLKSVGDSIGLEVSAESALAAGGVMGVMIIPFISSLSDDVMSAVPQNLRDGSFALGATKSETIKKVVLPAALPGIVGSILLAVSRAVGETMIVVMASGLMANITLNPLDSTSTITAQIVTILIGDQQFGDPKTQAAFALGMSLFVLTLLLNLIALGVVKRFREKYE